MKKFFTLIACALVAGSAFAQDYTDLGNLITNGTIPYKKAGYTAEDLPNFVSAEWKGEEKVTGVPRVVVDPDDVDALEAGSLSARTAKYCLAASTREVPQDVDDEGNPKFDDNGDPVYKNLDPWDSRFYITLPIDLAPGDKVKFSMNVRAKRAATISAQGHADATGNAYKVFRMQGSFCSNIEVPDDQWLEYTKEVEWQDADDGVNTFAFDIGASASNEFYFKNIVCEVQQKKLVQEDAEKPAEPTGYVIYENRATDLSTLSVKYFKNYTNAAKIADGAIVVTSLDADKSYADLYTDNTEGSEVKLTNNWDTQFSLRPFTRSKVVISSICTLVIRQMRKQMLKLSATTQLQSLVQLKVKMAILAHIFTIHSLVMLPSLRIGTGSMQTLQFLMMVQECRQFAST